MPYVDTATRQLLDTSLEAVACRIAKMASARPGDMNYAISALIKKVYGTKLKYADYNEIIGVLEDAKLEFYRSRVAPYEDKKKIENGDLYLDKP
jgi:hypothetical protein